jgi:hypothetical protein
MELIGVSMDTRMKDIDSWTPALYYGINTRVHGYENEMYTLLETSSVL